MTWLKGQTTWSALGSKIVGLACGEQPDDSGVTVVPAQRWRRQGIASDLGLMTPAATDYDPGPMAGRAGYFNAISNAAAVRLVDGAGNPPLYQGMETKTWVRLTSCFTANPTGFSASGKAWMVIVACVQANTVAGDYSDAKFTWRYKVVDDPSASSYQNMYETQAAPNVMPNSSTYNNVVGVSPAADGTLALTKGAVVKVGSPDGFVQSGAVFARLFTPATYGGYLGGIDYWPWLRQESPGTFSWDTAPTGVQGTDWAVVRNRGIGFAWAYSWGMGLGIKTNAGLTGDRYVARWKFHKFAFRFAHNTSGTFNGTINIRPGAIVTDGASAATVSTAHYDAGSPLLWLKAFATPGSVNPTSQVQYWLKVTEKALLLLVNADPGDTGLAASAMIGELTRFPASVNGSDIETLPVIWTRRKGYATQTYSVTEALCPAFNDYVFPADGPVSTMFNAYGMRFFQNGFKEGGRDYQTGWMRTDLGVYGYFTTSLNYYDFGVPSASQFDATGRYATLPWGVGGGAPGYSGAMQSHHCLVPAGASWGQGDYGNMSYTVMPGSESHPDPLTGAWRLYSWAFADQTLGNTTVGNPHANMRGFLDCGVWQIPGSGWANGDRVVDTVSGVAHFLLRGSYPALPVGNGGIAAEES